MSTAIDMAGYFGHFVRGEKVPSAKQLRAIDAYRVAFEMFQNLSIEEKIAWCVGDIGEYEKMTLQDIELLTTREMRERFDMARKELSDMKQAYKDDIQHTHPWDNDDFYEAMREGRFELTADGDVVPDLSDENHIHGPYAGDDIADDIDEDFEME